MAINAGRTGFDRVAIFRPHNVYGPDMAWEHVVPQFCLRAVDLVERHPDDPLPFPIQGDGTQTRAFTHIDDMIDGLMLVVERGAHLNIYHVGNPEELSIADVARQVVACFGREARLITSEAAPGLDQPALPGHRQAQGARVRTEDPVRARRQAGRGLVPRTWPPKAQSSRLSRIDT